MGFNGFLHPAGLGSRDTEDAYARHNEERKKYAALVRETRGQSDPNELADYQTKMGAPVDEAFQRASAGMAQAYAARGLSGTPVAAGGASGVGARADVLKDAAARRAADAARNSTRRRLLDEYGVQTDSWSDQNARTVNEAAAAAEQEQKMWAMLALLGSSDGGDTGGGGHS